LATDGGERGDATGLTSVSAGLLSPTSALCATRKACAASFPCFSPTKSFASASVNSTTMSSNVLNPARPMCQLLWHITTCFTIEGGAESDDAELHRPRAKVEEALHLLR
jgi:hypothetical protein